MTLKPIAQVTLLALALSLSACGGKDKQADKPADTAKAKAAAKADEKPAKKAADSPKYQATLKALDPSFALLKTPIKLGKDDDGDHNVDGKDVSADLLAKHLGYDKVAAEKNGGYGIMGIAAVGRLMGPDGDTRYLVAHFSPVNSQTMLYAFDADAETWVPTVVNFYIGEDPENQRYKSCTIQPDGTVKMTEWQTKFEEPGNFDTEVVVGKKKQTTVAFKGGQWQ